MHSYLGLAALAVMRHPELRSIDSGLCMSVSAREHFEQGTELGRGAFGGVYLRAKQAEYVKKRTLKMRKRFGAKVDSTSSSMYEVD